MELADGDLTRSPIRRLIGFPRMNLSLIGFGVRVAPVSVGDGWRRAKDGEHRRRR